MHDRNSIETNHNTYLNDLTERILSSKGAFIKKKKTNGKLIEVGLAKVHCGSACSVIYSSKNKFISYLSRNGNPAPLIFFNAKYLS